MNRVGRLTAQRERARNLAAALEEENARLTSGRELRSRVGEQVRHISELQAELETALRDLDAARSEVARLNSNATSPQ